MKKFFIVILVSIVFLFLSFSLVYAEGKRITVNLQNQTLTAWENDQVVYQTAVSTGLSQTPTIRGNFAIYTKIPSQRMTGGSQSYGYYDLPNVPYVMYFSGAYSIHGAYWHNNFGQPMSHGCVNAPLVAAAWLYNWAPIGTSVSVL